MYTTFGEMKMDNLVIGICVLHVEHICRTNLCHFGPLFRDMNPLALGMRVFSRNSSLLIHPQLLQSAEFRH